MKSQKQMLGPESKLKQSPETPTTSESLTQTLPSPLCPEAIGFSVDFCENKEQGNLFRFLQNQFESKLIICDSNKDSIVQKRDKSQQTQIFHQEKIGDYLPKFQILVSIENDTSGTPENRLKVFEKQIMKQIKAERQNLTTLIFERQHQKVKIDHNVSYFFNVEIATDDGFSKKIFSNSFTVPENFKKWEVVKIESQNKNFCLQIQIQKFGSFFIKPLSLKLPRCEIEYFFDYKYKLLNKSQILNELTSITELKGILYELSKQNMGSRIIQKLLSKAKNHQIEQVLKQLRPYFPSLILDRYGNYIFQKLFKICGKSNKMFCLSALQKDIFALLKSKQGTHCFQGILGCMDAQEIEEKFGYFSEEQIVDLATNKFSMFFVQKLVSLAPMRTYYQYFVKNFKLLCENKNGIVIMKTCIQIYSQDITQRYEILQQCQNNLNELMCSEYGHYIIEEFLMKYSYQQMYQILEHICCYSVFFSKNQYSSSVIRKAIDMYEDYVAVPVIDSILQYGLLELMENPSGEFILHRLMQQTHQESSKKKLIQEMMLQTKNVLSFQKRQKWMHFFGIQK